MANNPENANSIKGLIQGLIPTPGGIVQGTVMSISPITIRVEGDEKLILTAYSIIVPRHLTDYSIPIDTSGTTMKIYNALKVGDKVHLLSFNGQKQFYVLDKVV